MQQQRAWLRRTVLAAAASVAVAACVPADDSATADARLGDTTGAMGAGGGAAMTESAALGTVAAVHSAEVQSGRLAQERATNQEVKQFAQRITEEHQAFLTRLRALNTNADTSAADPALVRMADSAMQRLRTLEGAAFDTAWVNAQVAMHQGALQRLQAMAGQPWATGGQAAAGNAPDASPAGRQPTSQSSGTQPPGAQPQGGQAGGQGNTGEYLENTRQLIEQHLEAARQLQQRLGGAAGR